jgi:hypothetical protein
MNALLPERVRRAWWHVRWHARRAGHWVMRREPPPAAEDMRQGRLEALDAGLVRQLDEYRG